MTVTSLSLRDLLNPASPSAASADPQPSALAPEPLGASTSAADMSQSAPATDEEQQSTAWSLQLRLRHQNFGRETIPRPPRPRARHRALPPWAQEDRPVAHQPSRLGSSAAGPSRTSHLRAPHLTAHGQATSAPSCLGVTLYAATTTSFEPVVSLSQQVPSVEVLGPPSSTLPSLFTFAPLRGFADGPKSAPGVPGSMAPPSNLLPALGLEPQDPSWQRPWQTPSLEESEPAAAAPVTPVRRSARLLASGSTPGSAPARGAQPRGALPAWRPEDGHDPLVPPPLYSVTAVQDTHAALAQATGQGTVLVPPPHMEPQRWMAAHEVRLAGLNFTFEMMKRIERGTSRSARDAMLRAAPKMIEAGFTPQHITEFSRLPGAAQFFPTLARCAHVFAERGFTGPDAGDDVGRFLTGRYARSRILQFVACSYDFAQATPTLRRRVLRIYSTIHHMEA